MNEVLELFFSPSDAAVEDKSGDKKIIWKDILREGRFPVTPGRKRKIPFEVVPTGVSSVTNDGITISMAELLKSYEDKAFESVTIPLRHPKPGEDADVLNNTGYVDALRIVKKDDKHYLQAGMGFTEPDVAGKVRRGTIPNVSSGIFFNFTRKSDDKTFPVALNHVCLTKTPVIDDLEPFQRVYASDDAIDNADDIKIEVIDLEDDDGGGNEKAEVVWNEQLSTKWIVTEIRSQLSPEEPQVEGVPTMPRPYYEVLDVSREDTALVEEWFKGDRKRWVIPFEVGDNKVTISPATRWVEVREAMIAASDDFEERSYHRLTARLNDALGVMLGDGVGKSFCVDQVTTDGRVSVKNVDDQSVFLAEFVEVGSTILLSATSDWDRISDPVPEEKPDPKRVVEIFDANTPEGRVARARQQRRLQMSSHKSQ